MTAVERAAALYKQDGKAAVSPASAVRAWGYNTLNGRSLRVLGALRQFGLIEDAGPRSIRLTPLALSILLTSPNSGERLSALETAATLPTIFVKLAATYDDEFPSDESMIHNLVVHDKFSEEAARGVVAALRETLSCIDKASLPIREPKPAKAAKLLEGRESVPDETPKQGVRMANAGRESLDIPFPLVSGGQAILRLPRSMSEEEYTMLTTLIDTMLRGMKKALVSATAMEPKASVEEED
jgi:hypothetical protein